MNPYQAPPTIDDAAAIAEPGDTRIDWIPAAVAGLRWMQLGSRIVLFCVMFVLTAGVFVLVNSTNSVLIGVIFVASLLGMAATGLGSLSWLTVSKLAIATLTLHLIGSSGVAIYADMVLRGSGTGGLVNLFGASSMAMLLTGQSLVMVKIYRWNKQTGALGIAQSATLSIFGYAFCAVVMSLHSLPYVTLPVSAQVMTLSVILAGVLSIGNQLVVMRQTIRHLRDVAQDRAQTE